MGIDERDLAASLIHFSGGRHRPSQQRWRPTDEPDTTPQPREHRISDDQGPPSGPWLPEQTWLRQTVRSRLGFAFAWLLVGGLALWGWYGWISFASGFWEVLALPLAGLGLWAATNKFPTALGGKRLLVSSSGMTFFPPGSVRPPAYFPWHELHSVDVSLDSLPQIVATPVSPPTEDSPALRLWSEEHGRYEIGIMGIRTGDAYAALVQFAPTLDAGPSPDRAPETRNNRPTPPSPEHPNRK